MTQAGLAVLHLRRTIVTRFIQLNQRDLDACQTILSRFPRFRFDLQVQHLFWSRRIKKCTA
jgi:hypothetical protein